MTLPQKILHLQQILLQPEENYADSFKADIIMYFNDDFSAANNQFEFLNHLNSQQDIQNWVALVTSKFVLKFNPDEESENDFIAFYTTSIT